MANLSVVIPIYNEEENIIAFYGRLKSVLQSISGYSYEIIFIDDGSRDNSYQLVEHLCKRDTAIRCISLSRNFGHQIALTAGIDHTKGDVVIMMDADLQHPPELIAKLIETYEKGFDLVLTNRIDHEQTKLFKKWTSRLFYKIMNYLSSTNIQPASADFRLMSRKTVDAFRKFKEHSRFNRGLISWMGFKHTTITYTADRRVKGQSKYNFRRMLQFALDGVTSFSSRPLRLSFYLGLIISFFSMIYAMYAITIYFQERAISGWTSLLLSILILGGIQLIGIGILGEYLGRIFDEVKNRPLYLIKEDTAQMEERARF